MGFQPWKSNLGVARPSKKLKVDKNAMEAMDVLELPIYIDNDDNESFEFNNDNVDDLPDYVEFLDKRSEPLLKENCYRKAVAFLFVTELKAIDNNHEAWSGRNGIRKEIRERLGLPRNARLDHILIDVLACKKAGISYEGEQQVGDANLLGKPPILSVDSVEEQIIADALESGTSIPNACWQTCIAKKLAKILCVLCQCAI
jgi:hypothetical protein